MKQLSLFEGEELRQGTLFGVELPPPPKRKGGSANPIIFRDYESLEKEVDDEIKRVNEIIEKQTKP